MILNIARFVLNLESMADKGLLASIFSELSLDPFIDAWAGVLEQFFNCIQKIMPNES